MHSFSWVRFSLLAALVVSVSRADAKRIAIPPLSDRIAKSAVVVVGKVTSVENKTVKTPQGEMAIAVVKVETASGDAKALTHVKVAFQGETLMNGEEYMLFLGKATEQGYYPMPRFFDVVRKSDGGYEAQVQAVKKAISFLDDPKKGFQSKDASDRLLCAALLLGKYRPWGMASEKVAPIDAAESKAILEALAEADWMKIDPLLQTNVQQLFYRLGLTEADGWKQPANFQQLIPVAKEWLKANAGTYRVKRFVTEK